MAFVNNTFGAIGSLFDPALRTPIADIARHQQDRDDLLYNEGPVSDDLAQVDQKIKAVRDDLSGLHGDFEEGEDRRNKAAIEKHQGMSKPQSHD
jgi:hypothetical protein